MQVAMLMLLAISLGMQPPPSPEVGPIPVVGTVVDAAGKPVAGAEVWLTRARRPQDDRRSGVTLAWEHIFPPEEETPRVFSRTRSGADGRFRLDIPADVASRADPIALAVWATHPGHATALHRLPATYRPAGTEVSVRLSLGVMARAAVTVRDPAGRPLAGVKVVPSQIRDIPVPVELGEAFGATTDANGNVGIDGIDRGALGAVRVATAELGIQEVALDDHASPALAAMAPAGRVGGRLVPPADFREPLKAFSVHVRSLSGGFRGSGVVGEAVVACDGSGRFVVPAVAAGLVRIRVVADEEQSPLLRAMPLEGLELEAGSTLDRDIPLRPAVRIVREVRDRGTDRPIAGVQMQFGTRLNGGVHPLTDARGRAVGAIARDDFQVAGWSFRLPIPYFETREVVGAPQGMPTRDRAEHVMPPLRVPKGVDVRGIVRDPDGRPVADAEVETVLRWGRLVRTDTEGRFVLPGIDPRAELRLLARHGSMTSGPPIEVVLKDKQAPIELKLRRSRTARLGGRVVDSSGRPIAGASVRIIRLGRDGKTFGVNEAVAGDDGSCDWRTDAEGRFRSGPLVAREEYAVEASALGRLSARAPVVMLVPAGEEAVGAVPDLVLRRVVAVEGQVVDHAGAPVAGAVLRQSGDGPLHTRARTDGQGRFRLPGFLEGPAILFASGDGYRPQFQAIDAGAGPVSVRLARTSEPPSPTYRPVPPPLPPEEEQALARRLFFRHAEPVLAKGTDAEKFDMIFGAVQVDPLTATEKFGSTWVTDAKYEPVLRPQLVRQLAAVNLDEALTQAEAGTTPQARAQSYLALCRALRGKSGAGARRREVAIQAVVQARAIEGPARALALAEVAGVLIDLGDVPAARKLVDEATAAGRAQHGPAGGLLILGKAAMVLGRIDQPAARAILDQIDRRLPGGRPSGNDRVMSSVCGDFAITIAAELPDEAERALELARRYDPRYASRGVVVACGRMAARDPARARRLAETRIEADAGALVPWTLGMVAAAQAATDRPAAEAILEDAFRRLEDQAAGVRPPRPQHDPSAVAGALLRIVEEVAPDRLGEYLARAIALRKPPRDADDLAHDAVARSLLPIFVARYDRELALRLIRPAVDRLPQLKALGAQDSATYYVLPGLAAIDPREAVERIESMPDDAAAGQTGNRQKHSSVEHASFLLAKQDRVRWLYVLENFSSLWHPENELH